MQGVDARLAGSTTAVGYWVVQTLSHEAGQNRLTPLRATYSDAVPLPPSEGQLRGQKLKMVGLGFEDNRLDGRKTLTPEQIRHIERLGRKGKIAVAGHGPTGDWLTHRETPAFELELAE